MKSRSLQRPDLQTILDTLTPNLLERTAKMKSSLKEPATQSPMLSTWLNSLNTELRDSSNSTRSQLLRLLMNM
jgi:hypothetical protein